MPRRHLFFLICGAALQIIKITKFRKIICFICFRIWQMHQYFLKEATFHKQWRNFDNKGWNFLYQKLQNLIHISIERDISSIWNFLKLIIYFWLLCCIKIFLGNTYSLNCALGISYRQIRLHNYRTAAPNKVWNFLSKTPQPKSH